MPEGEDETIRCRVMYAGRVQGVGFRYRTERIAAGLPVAGYVRNLPDGRVEMVAEGAREAVGRLLTTIDAEMAGYIRDRQVVEGAATGEFGGFSVRF
jgi:acylphosphatase